MSRRPAKSSSSQHSALSTQHCRASSQHSALSTQHCRASSQHSALSTQHSSVRPAFTFLEVLFAVIIIGIGVIMIAAMFPVAILQQQSNVNEAAAVSIGRDAIHYLQTSLDSVQPQTTLLASNATTTLPLLPCTTGALAPAGILELMPLPNALVAAPTATYAANQLVAQTIKYNPASSATDFYANPAVAMITGNQIPTADKRFSWLGFYRRDTIVTNINGVATATAAPYAQVWVFVAQSTVEGQPTFSTPPAITVNNFCTGGILQYNSAGSIINFFLATPTTPFPAVADAHVLIVHCNSDPNLIGQVYRLGNPVPAAQIKAPLQSIFPAFYLLPGSDVNPYDSLFNNTGVPGPVPVASGSTLSAGFTAFVLGSSPDPTTGQYIGPAQDITVVRGYVRINN